jgi:hypothetical protein
VIDWTGDSLSMSENNYVKIVGGIVKATKDPIVAEINKQVQGTQSLAQPQAEIAVN